MSIFSLSEITRHDEKLLGMYHDSIFISFIFSSSKHTTRTREMLRLPSRSGWKVFSFEDKKFKNHREKQKSERDT